MAERTTVNRDAVGSSPTGRVLCGCGRVGLWHCPAKTVIHFGYEGSNPSLPTISIIKTLIVLIIFLLFKEAMKKMFIAFCNVIKTKKLQNYYKNIKFI